MPLQIPTSDPIFRPIKSSASGSSIQSYALRPDHANGGAGTFY
jgi:hypothetical protein